MWNIQYDLKRIKALKEITLRLRSEESAASIQREFDQSFKHVRVVDILLIQLELLNSDDDITVEDMKKLTIMRSHLMREEADSSIYHPAHPVQIFKEENAAFQIVLNQINYLLELFEEEEEIIEDLIQETDIVDGLKDLIFQLGEFHNHYNRKEKLFFPIMERYGYYAPARAVWRKDDRVRALYQALKKQISRLPIDITRIRKRYDMFEREFKEMIFQEEAMILPILQSIFSEEDWLAIANESDAFGYALIEAPKKQWIAESGEADKAAVSVDNLVFGGGGYLTTEEAELILNNLPLEITFVDKNDMFKYFNKMTDAAEMMLVRTPSSIGRNVANCHPPKSLMKVMTVIRNLKTRKRTSESMWYKKNEQYIHITYKAIFNEAGEFLGILEYVQDIQPFFELPNEVKTGISEMEDQKGRPISS